MGAKLVVSCEHASNRVPARYRPLLAGRAAVLISHRAYDPGALELSRRIARANGVQPIATSYTRLLIEPNRSPHHRHLFSEFSRTLPREARDELVAKYYVPHRRRVEWAVRDALSRGGVAVHLAVHSFTPVLRGRRRNADVGLLYDPSRPPERRFCAQLRAALQAAAPQWTIRLNYPYRGDADGLTTDLRRKIRSDRYLGIELEINQNYPRGPRPRWLRMQRVVIRCLAEAMSTRK
jgi:predicted N-formylglutamate amidohydrolase